MSHTDLITEDDYNWLLERFNTHPAEVQEAIDGFFKAQTLTTEQARFLGSIEGQLKQMTRDREAIRAYITGAGK